jgi:GNAT superfamily N-acetyltransferase
MTPDPSAEQLLGLAAVTPATIEAARDIYEAGFPAAERAPFEDLLDVRTDERMQFLLDGDAGADAVLGVVLVRDLGETDWTFLRYFVVAADRRGHGVGGRLWSALCRDLAARGRRRLLFDVEDPDDPAADRHEVDERWRRVRFYRRAGADLVAADSYAPPHHGAPGTPTMPLRPMGAELDAAGRSRPLDLDPAGIEDLIGVVMRYRYAVTSPRGLSAASPDGGPA